MRTRAVIWFALVAIGIAIVAMACGGSGAVAREEEPPLAAEDGCVTPSAKCVAAIPEFAGARLPREASILCDRVADLAERVRWLEPGRADL